MVGQGGAGGRGRPAIPAPGTAFQFALTAEPEIVS